MASPAIIYTPEDDSSDYGSDFSPDIVEKLIETLEHSAHIQDIEDIAGSSHSDNGSSKRLSRRPSAKGWETHYPVLAALGAACEDESMGLGVDFTTAVTESNVTSATTSMSSTSKINEIHCEEKRERLTDQALCRYKS